MEIYQLIEEAPIMNEYIDAYESMDMERHYFYNNHPVPRTSDILSAMLHNQRLMIWSNRLGRYQHQDYNEYLQKAAFIGSTIHSCIERYIKEGLIPQNGDINFTIENYVNNAFKAFLVWWDYVNNHHTVKVIYCEKSMVCRFFGGTLDLLLEIDGKKILVDFKSSNYPSFKFFLQLASYRYMLRDEGIDIDGCIVLMLNKHKPLYNEMFLDFTLTEHLQFMNECEKTFLTLVQGYLQRIYIENKFESLFPSKYIKTGG